MTDEEKKLSIIRALNYILESKKGGTLQELIDWLKGITPAKIKTLIIAQARLTTNNVRSTGESYINASNAEEAYITELENDW